MSFVQNPETFLRLVVTRHLLGAALACPLIAPPAHASDGFRVRYPLSGTLGGEIVAPADKPGWFGSLVVTQMEVDKITDDSGHARMQPVSGAFATPQPVAGAVRTATFSGTVAFDARQSQTMVNLLVGYLTEQTFGGGRLSFMVNVPTTTRLDRRLTLSGATPTLSPLSPPLTSPPLPPGTAAMAQAAAQAGFASAYQANLAAQSAAGSGVVDGVGDVEVTGAWVLQQQNLRLAAGATLALPTGDYDAASSLNVGFGNCYTLRPHVTVAYSPSDTWTLGARASLGFNTRNDDNQVRSGNFGALDLAAAWRSPIGVVGPHVLHVQQVQDDSGGPFGANRFSATGAGAFFTTRIAALDAALNASYLKMVRSQNALSGSFVQLRLSKAF
jgi:hypothetical protein